ncbi:MAG TPA: gliding motility-associated C-terminal domain-containing protein [Puia sp.]|nr:gliding motility-associated C-terminal domain-containing protein [Puia sp.]
MKIQSQPLSPAVASSPAPPSVLERQISIAGDPIDPFCMVRDRNDGYLLAATYTAQTSDIFAARTTAFIHLDKNGCVDWSESLPPGRVEVIQAMIATSDGGFLVSSFPHQDQTQNYPRFLILFKLDRQGALRWSHAYVAGNSVNNYYSALSESADKGYLVEAGSFPTDDNSSFLSIFKTDDQGNIRWSRGLAMESSAQYNVGGILEKHGFVYASGSVYEPNAAVPFVRSFLVRLNTDNGSVAWVKQNDAGQSLRFSDIHVYRDGLLVNSSTPDGLTHLIYTSDDGTVLGANRISNPYGSLKGGENIFVDGSNDIYFHQASGLFGSKPKYIMMRLNAERQILWQYDFASSGPEVAGWYQLEPAEANGFAALGSGQSPEGFGSLTFLKSDSTGAGCYTITSDLTINPESVSLPPAALATNTDLAMTIVDSPQVFNPFTVGTRLFCPADRADGAITRLPRDTIFCGAADAALNAGGGYIKYLWQNGSADPVLPVSQAGTYWVSRTGTGGCTTTDTVHVEAILSTPAGFLPPDTVACNSEPLLLKPLRPYAGYLWNTGETGVSIQVNGPGIYTLQVTDNNGCTGSDSIRVTTRKCADMIYFPNAFTPEGAGSNRIFRPVVDGNPTLYSFRIFNRWGQCVFESSTPGQGWDGRLNGVTQATGAYIWDCIYRFGAGQENHRRGNFILIR